MSTANVVYMLVVLGLVWGGFAYCLFLLWTQGDQERESDEPLP